ncbi:MAG TPA: hypothetical protein VM513_30100 [Kofleriaceae bacterium]|jgi:hypothetical protein|nr:hypothetical protein [Kofleriaceae bacterium]
MTLEAKVTARKAELIAEIIEHKMNCSRAGAANEVDRLKARLSDLARIVKEGVVDGWGNVGPKARIKLEQWMEK